MNILDYRRSETDFIKFIKAYHYVPNYKIQTRWNSGKDNYDPEIGIYEDINLQFIRLNSSQKLKGQYITWWEEFNHLHVTYPQQRPLCQYHTMQLFYKDDFNYLTYPECKQLDTQNTLLDCLSRVEDEYMRDTSIEIVMKSIDTMIESFDGTADKSFEFDMIKRTHELYTSLGYDGIQTMGVSEFFDELEKLNAMD
jgi:hypothetical protein